MGTGFGKVDAALGTLNTSVAGNTTSISNLQTTVNNINSGTAGLVQQSAAGANLTVGKATDGAAVDFTGTAGTRKLIGVTDGTVAAGSKDAVNGEQLYATNQQVAQNTTNIAGNTTSINNLQTTVNNINSGAAGLVQQSAAGANVTVGKATDGAAVDFAGTAGARKLINVADDTVAANSKDAVDGGQLYTTNQQVAQQGTTTAAALGGTAAYNSGTGAISAPSYALSNANSIAGTGGAAADVGTGFGKVDAALGTLNTSVAGDTTSISNLQTTVNNISNGAAGLVQQSAAGART